MILELQRTGFRERPGFGTGFVAAAAFQRSVILRQHAVDPHRDVTRVDFLPSLKIGRRNTIS